MKRHKSGKMIGKGILKRTEAVHYVISPRGRRMDDRGMYDPHGKPAEGMPLSPQDYFLLSRAIRHMAYHERRGILEILFSTGHIYQYLGVPEAVWIAFQMAQSKGKYFHKHIYGYWSGKKGSKVYHPVYNYRRVR